MKNQIFLGLICWVIYFNSAAMDITGLDKKEVLRALFAAAQPFGYGFTHYNSNDTLTAQEVERYAKDGFKFDIDYIKGRLMKINLSQNIVNTRAYNSDNGEMAAENAIAHLRK